MNWLNKLLGKPYYKLYKNGDIYWYINDRFHREDGPAIEYANGNKSWYLNGKLHREDGPAIEDADGHKSWYLNGKLHREDGPAVEFADGRTYYYINGKYIHKLDNKRIYGKENLQKLLLLI